MNYQNYIREHEDERKSNIIRRIRSMLEEHSLPDRRIVQLVYVHLRHQCVSGLYQIYQP